MPKTISKRIGDAGRAHVAKTQQGGEKVKAVTPLAVPDNPMLGKLLEQMEKQMLDHAQN